MCVCNIDLLFVSFRKRAPMIRFANFEAQSPSMRNSGAVERVCCMQPEVLAAADISMDLSESLCVLMVLRCII
jgi:hypothetical protein